MGCQFYRVIIIFPPGWNRVDWSTKFFFWGGTLKDDTLIIFRSNHIVLIQVQINSSLLMYYIQDLRKVWKSRGGMVLIWGGRDIICPSGWDGQIRTLIRNRLCYILMGREYEWKCPTVNSNVYICFQSRGGGASSNLEGLSSLLVWLGLFELPQLPISM